MNKLFFTGRVVAAPELNNYGDTKVARFRLIRNEYAGKDKAGQRKEREVSINFSAFGSMGANQAAAAGSCRRRIGGCSCCIACHRSKLACIARIAGHLFHQHGQAR